jgi:hypothetical protein
MKTRGRSEGVSLETTQMTRSFKMLTLLAMLDEDRFPDRIDIESLMSGFRARVERSAVLQEDVGVRSELCDGGDQRDATAGIERE